MVYARQINNHCISSILISLYSLCILYSGIASFCKLSAKTEKACYIYLPIYRNVKYLLTPHKVCIYFLSNRSHDLYAKQQCLSAVIFIC